MIEFKVNRNRIIKYLSKYNFNEPEDFFLADEDENGRTIYSIDQSDILFTETKPNKKLTELISLAGRFVKDELEEKQINNGQFDDFLFLIAYFGVFNEIGITTNHISNNILSNTELLIETAILLKNGNEPMSAAIKYLGSDSVGKTIKYILPTSTYLTSTHYLKALAIFLRVNISNLETLLNPNSTLDQLNNLLKETRAVTHKRTIKIKATQLMRDYLEMEFLIKRGNAKNISSKQVQMLYPVFEFLSWIEPLTNYSSLDKLRSEINRYFDLND